MRSNLLRLSIALALSTSVGWAGTPTEIYRNTGIRGGLVVHYNCGDGELTTALRANTRYVVHGLEPDADRVKTARRRVESAGLQGSVVIGQWSKPTLPYADNLVNLFVAEGRVSVPKSEIMRVLSPEGVAYIESNGRWTLTRKPRPAEIGEWTHYLHGPDNNAVTPDTVVDVPRHIQWYAPPKHMRSHDHLSSFSALVAQGGRVFYIVDEGPIESVGYPSEWYLIARDAFSGVLLWKHPISSWEDRFRGFRSGPPEIGRRLVAVDELVYVTMGYDQPVSVLDAATGEVIRVCEGTADTREFVIAGDTLLAVAAKPLPKAQQYQGKFVFWPMMRTTSTPTRLIAVDTRSGKKQWEKKSGFASEIMPTACAVSGNKVYVQTTRELVCLDLETGMEVWRSDRPIGVTRYSWSTPTVVVSDGVVISADRDPPKDSRPEGKITWNVISNGGNAPPGQMIAFDAFSGKRLWSAKCKEGYNAPVDVFVIDGLVWSGDVVQSRGTGFTQALDVRTGEIKRTRASDLKSLKVRMAHHRCYRNRATSRYLLLGRCGIELLDVKSGKIMSHDWVRGACQYGVMPANGLIYSPPHPCACHIESKLTGFYTLAPAGTPITPDQNHLQRGPVHSRPNATDAADESLGWPTFRSSNQRDSRTSSSAPSRLSQTWRAKIGGALTAPTIAGGKLFVAQKELHVLHAIDAANGRPAWTFTAGGRIDSPPTIWRGLVLLGSHDGHVYCLRAADGELVWRYRAGPTDRLVVVDNQLESAWPVPGSILVHDGKAWFAAGRSSHLDGGMIICGIDAATGETRVRKWLYDSAKSLNKAGSIPGALFDVLSSDGTSLFLRHNRLSFTGERQPATVPHIYSSAGLLDGTWWHRTYLQYGTRMPNSVGWGTWARQAQSVPTGRILAMDDTNVYGYGRVRVNNGIHISVIEPDQTFKVGSNAQFHLFAQPKARPKPAGKPKRGRRPAPKKVLTWATPTNIHVRGLALASDILVLAGSPVAKSRVGATKAMRGGAGGRLVLASKSDGKLGASIALTSPPVFDGLAVANGRVYICQLDGSVVCIGE